MNNMLLKTYTANLHLSDFIETAQENIIEYSCPLCEGILFDAVIDHCGHSFCLSCVETLIRNQKNCPFTNNLLKINNLIRNNVVNNIIEKQTVYCKNKDQGCTWSSKLSERKDHLYYECQKAQVMCRFDCGNYLSRDNINEHEGTCDLRVIDCQFCNSKIKYGEINEHYINSCSNYPKKCTCGLAIPQNIFNEHIENDCEDKIINCPFNLVGCLFKDYRKIVKSHVNDKLEYHLKILTQKISGMEDTIYKQNTDVINLSQQNDLLKLEIMNLKANIDKRHSEMFSLMGSLNKSIEQVKQYSVIPYSNVLNNNEANDGSELLNSYNSRYYEDKQSDSLYLNSYNKYINPYAEGNVIEEEIKDINEVFEFNSTRLTLTKVANNYGWYGISFSLGNNFDKNKFIVNMKINKSSNNCIMLGFTYNETKLPLVGGFYKNTKIESYMFYTFNYYTYKNGLLYKNKKLGVNEESKCVENDIISMIIDFDNDKIIFSHNGVLIEELSDVSELKEKRDYIRVAVDMSDTNDKISFI